MQSLGVVKTIKVLQDPKYLLPGELCRGNFTEVIQFFILAVGFPWHFFLIESSTVAVHERLPLITPWPACVGGKVTQGSCFFWVWGGVRRQS